MPTAREIVEAELGKFVFTTPYANFPEIVFERYDGFSNEPYVFRRVGDDRKFRCPYKALGNLVVDRLREDK